MLGAGRPRIGLRIEALQVTYNRLSGAMSERLSEALIAEFPPWYEYPLITHAGGKFRYVLAGNLVLQVEDEEFGLDPGDSFHIFSGQPHSIPNETDQVGKILWVQTLKLLKGGSFCHTIAVYFKFN